MLKNPIFKKVMIVIAGSAAGQLITFMFMPILTRIYSPSVIGTQSLFMSISTMLVPLGSLAFSLAIIRSKDKEDCQNIISFCFFIAILVLILLSALFYAVYYFDLFSWRGVLGVWLLFIPFYVFLFSCVDIIKKNAFNEGKVNLVSKYNVFSSFSMNSSKAIGGIVSPTDNMILVCINLCTLCTLIWFWIKTKIKLTFKGVIESKSIFCRFIDFPKYRCPQMVINSISQSLPLFFITSQYDIHFVGLYSLAWTVLVGPINLIGQSLNNVLYPAYSDLEKKGKSLKGMFLKNTAILTSGLITIPIFFPYFSDVFSLVFGSEWRESGNIAKYLFFLCLCMIISKPSISIIPVINVQKQFFIFEVVSFLAKVGTLITCVLLQVKVETLVTSYSVVGSFSYIILTVMTWSYLKRFERKNV
jgi:O-antigen/teichoic acid export membrane protein